MKYVIKIIALSSLLALSVSAIDTIVLGFENLGSGQHDLPPNYAGLSWDPSYDYYDYLQWPLDPESSGPVRLIYGNWIDFGTNVTFLGSWVGRFNWGGDIYWRGYKNGEVVYESIHFPDGVATSGWINVNWPNVDRVELVNGGGNCAIDDISYSVTIPEPSTGLDYTYTSNGSEITITGYTGAGGDITIPSIINGLPVTTIGYHAFIYNDSLTSLVIPHGITTIEHEICFGCNGLTSISIPDSVTFIGYNAFKACGSLTAAVLPDSITTLGSGIFQYCGSLTNAVLPNSITTIPDWMFTGTDLSSITIPSTITSIGVRAFAYGNGNLKYFLFLGNPPTLHTAWPFYQVNPEAVVYYLEGATGWGSSFGGFPTALWNNSPNKPPVADAGQDQIVSAYHNCSGWGFLDGTGSSDPDGDPLTYYWEWNGGSATGATLLVNLPLGTNNVTLYVTDGIEESSDTVTIIVADTTAPSLSISATPVVLWPPTHKMETIDLTIFAADNCDRNPVVVLDSITMNEGDYEDYEIVDLHKVMLRSERSGNQQDRIYTLHYSATDSSGNSTDIKIDITVPHDRQDKTN